MPDPQFLILAHAMADAAGEILRKHFRTSIAIEHKADATPVTQADREAESAMRALIEKQFPDHGIFGEEHGRKNETSPYQWVIDPIDGTRAFIAGKATFTTLIALCHHDVPMLGIIDQPVTKERWVGVQGKATECNGAPVSVKAAAALSQAQTATTSTNYFTRAQAMRFSRLQKATAQTQLGGDAYAYATLASGKLDIVADASMKPYDFCALAPVVEGAGGVITDWDGKPLTVKSDGSVLAAASAGLHDAAFKALAIV
jgi:inositol-phosphate phosphatase / L-galactose 1-phosphate phosphatase / histidinol-phosphatase